jgi:hypothetical protein
LGQVRRGHLKVFDARKDGNGERTTWLLLRQLYVPLAYDLLRRENGNVGELTAPSVSGTGFESGSGKKKENERTVGRHPW